ncbi:MAG: hypothetical protein FJX74_25205 [Armatimonadetes bacterium]|nr:hypothetical protein [Armatimonadota bacterium]
MQFLKIGEATFLALDRIDACAFGQPGAGQATIFFSGGSEMVLPRDAASGLWAHFHGLIGEAPREATPGEGGPA